MQETPLNKLSNEIPEEDKKKIQTIIGLIQKTNENKEKNISDSINTINILAMLKTDKATIQAEIAQLCDENTLKNTGQLFEKETISIIENKKKFMQTLEKYATTYENNPELKKILFFSLTKNPRLLILIIAEKFNELQNLKKTTKETATKIAIQAQEIIIPIIHKLGIKKIKSKAEDIVFEFLEPQKYQQIMEKIKEKRKKIEETAHKMLETILQKTKENKLQIQAFHRVKGTYSIYRKMVQKQKNIQDIHDLLAIRIITQSTKECYEILGLIHSLWVPITEEFDDYIIKPKENNYKSLHTTVIGENQTPIEIQIRSKEMDNEAELGIAAHWKYKGAQDQKSFDKKIAWINEFLSWKNEKNPQTEIKINFFSNRLYALTPKGKIIELPENSTVLDFAFAVHSSLGEHCIKGKVNDTIMPIDHVLENFDVVEILISQKQTPKLGWLNIAKTEKAKTKIKHALQLTQFAKKNKSKKKTFDIKSTDKRIRLAKCCMPIPGDEVIGFKTTKRKITVHRKECIEVTKFSGKTPIKINWETKKGSFLTEIKVIAAEKPGLLKELLQEISKHTQKINNATIKQLNPKTNICSFEIRIENLEEAEKIMNNISNISGIKKVTRT